MKLHHVAALALMGWYLISPPVTQTPQLDEDESPPPIQYDYNAPLSKWNRGATNFPDQPACDQYKCGELRSFRTMLIPDPERGLRIEALERSFCVHENDPRLKSK
jgi:hypothetical protein